MSKENEKMKTGANHACLPPLPTTKRPELGKGMHLIPSQIQLRWTSCTWQPWFILWSSVCFLKEKKVRYTSLRVNKNTMELTKVPTKARGKLLSSNVWIGAEGDNTRLCLCWVSWVIFTSHIMSHVFPQTNLTANLLLPFLMYLSASPLH